MTARVQTNVEHNGVEIVFPAKPEQQTIEALKAGGFRYNGKTKVWYHKDTPENRAAAEEIARTGVLPVKQDA